MSIKINESRRTVLAIAAAIAIAAMLWASAYSVGQAEDQAEEVLKASRRLALCDFAEASAQIEQALTDGDIEELYRAAGRAEAFFSRTGLEGCETVYKLIDNICNGAVRDEPNIESATELAHAAQAALMGDGGEALRNLYDENDEKNTTSVPTENRETEEKTPLPYQVLKRLGRGSDDIAQKTAKKFACPNAVLRFCCSPNAFPPCFKLSGENVFIELTSDGERVLLYCFDRDCDLNRTVDEKIARNTAREAIESERLTLKMNINDIPSDLDGGIYRFVFHGEGSNADVDLVTLEVYADTGRLRKFDALGYYRTKSN